MLSMLCLKVFLLHYHHIHCHNKSLPVEILDVFNNIFSEYGISLYAYTTSALMLIHKQVALVSTLN